MTDRRRPTSYSEAGVSISRGDAAAARIAKIQSTALGAVGGFAGSLAFDPTVWKRPRLVTTCDGVGTKVLLASRFDRFDTIGIDLVAMCVNDLAACGARPLAFQDYIACGRIDEVRVERIVRGVLLGCETAQCTLAGGETAEMPDLYDADEVDLAGFCAGFVEEDLALPRLDAMREGDVVLGFASNGIHSNGISLARKVLDLRDPVTVDNLLVPTRIYVNDVMATVESGRVKAAAHITGGGLVANISRVIPNHLRVEPTWEWPFPAIFDMIQQDGQVAIDEMRTVFNMGIGMVIVVDKQDAGDLLSEVSEVSGSTAPNPRLHYVGTLVA